MVRLTHRMAVYMMLLASFAMGIDSVHAQRSRGFGGFGEGRGGGFGGRSFGGAGLLGQLFQESTQQELKLTDDQKQKVEEIQEQMRSGRSSFAEFGARMREAETDEEREAIREEMRKQFEARQKETEQEVEKLLSPEQMSRLRQLALQTRGSSALADDEVAAELKLSDEQKAQIEALQEARGERQRELFEAIRNGDVPRDQMREKSDELRQSIDAEILAVLTPKQKRVWEQKLGPAPGETAAAATTSPAAMPAVAPAQAPVVAGSTQAAADGTEITQAVVASFGPDAERREAAGEESLETEPPVLSFNFRFAPWTLVLKLFADAAGLSLDLNAVPPGTFSYLDDGEYTPTEAIDVLNGYLLQKGYVMVRRDKFLTVMNLNQPIPPNLIPDVSIEELGERADNEIVRIVIPMDGFDVEAAAEEVKNLLGPQGQVVPMKTTSSVVATGLAKNLRRVHRMLQGATAPVDGNLVFKAFLLKHIAAVDAESVIRDLFGLGPRGVQNVSAAATGSPDASRSSRFSSRFGSRFGSSRFGSRGSSRESSNRTQPRAGSVSSSSSNGKVQVAVDERTNSLLVTAPVAEMKVVEQAVLAIDVGDRGNGPIVVHRPAEPYLEVYEVETADPTEVTKTLNVLFPGAVVNEDTRAERIHIHATPDIHREVAAVIRRLDGAGGGQSMEVIPLGRLDSLTAAAMLRSMFINERNNPPTIEPSPIGSGLLVRGTVEQISQCKALLAQIDPADGIRRAAGGPVRTVPLGGRDPQQFLQMLEQVWNTSNAQSNPIRVVVPSAASPIDDRRVPSRSLEDVGFDRELEPRQRQPQQSRPRLRPGADRPDTAGADARDSREAKRLEEMDLSELVGGIDSEVAVRELPGVGLILDVKSRKKPVDAIPVALQHSRPLRPDTDVSAVVADASPESAQPPSVKKAEEAKRPAVNAQSGEGAAAVADQPAPNASTEPIAPESARPPRKPIVVAPSGGNLVITSEDEEALDRLEDLIQTLSQAVPARNQWTVLYLRSADATETATMLERLFPASSVSTMADTSSSGFFGELRGGFSSMGRGLMNATGLSSLGTSPTTLQIIPDVRSNSLWVSGPPNKIREVEDVLKVLDASELPEQLRDRMPRYIEVQYADVEDVAQIVRDVYKDYMEPPAGQNNNGRGNGNPFAMLAGSRGGRGSSNGRAAELIRLTLGTDKRTNALIVSANDSLFRQIQDLVATLDQAAFEANRTVRVIKLQNSNSALVQEALTSLLPKVKVNTSTESGASGAASGSRPQTSGSSSANNGNSDNNGSSSSDADRLRQFMEMRQRMFQRGGDSGRSRSSGGDRSSGRFGGFRSRSGSGSRGR